MVSPRLGLCFALIAIGSLLISGCGGGADEGDSSTPSPTATSGEASAPLPTLDEQSGGYVGLTFEQASQLAPFDLVMPAPLPPGIEFEAASIARPPAPPGAEDWGDAREVALGFEPASGGVPPIYLYESPGHMNRCPDSSGSTVTIADTTIEKHVLEQPPGETFAFYCWDAHDLSFTLQAQIGPDLPVTEEMLEELVAATL